MMQLTHNGVLVARVYQNPYGWWCDSIGHGIFPCETRAEAIALAMKLHGD